MLEDIFLCSPELQQCAGLKAMNLERRLPHNNPPGHVLFGKQAGEKPETETL